MVLVHSGQPVLFHLGQVLQLTPQGHVPYLETHTQATVEWLLKPGTRVSSGGDEEVEEEKENESLLSRDLLQILR